MKKVTCFFSLLLSLTFVFSACSDGNITKTTTESYSLEASTSAIPETNDTVSTEATTVTTTNTATLSQATETLNIKDIPEYSGKAYITLNNNQPNFSEDEITTTAFEDYKALDNLGRCRTAFACLGTETMPKEERGEIGMIKPSGWKSVKYDCVDGKYLFNRCHLIGFQLSGENANDKNLITGTRYMNIEGMLPFENMVADYIKETKNHVMYRVTPVFDGDNLVCKGVKMEGYSVEDNGDGICFNIFCYNAQPSVRINYKNGESCLLVSSTHTATEDSSEAEATTYILNTNSKKFHTPDCSSVKNMSQKNKKEFTGTEQELINEGYSPCANCSK